MSLHLIFQMAFGHGQDWSNPDRLETELSYLREITLPSLAAQTDTNFRLLMLCDAALDEATRNRIRHTVWAQIDKRRAKVIFRGAGRSARFLTKSTNGRWDDRAWRVQVALDHDAAVASDYVSRMRAAAETRIKRMASKDDYLFLAFAAHYSLQIGDADARLFEKPAQRGDSGLALLSAHGHGLSPFALRGQPISADHPIDLIGGSKPFVLALLGPRPIRLPKGAKAASVKNEDKIVADAARRFGWLGKAIDALPQGRPV